MPLWRLHRTARGSTRAAALPRRSSRVAATRPRQRGPLQSLVMPQALRSAAAHTRQVLPQALVQLRNVLTALQQVARLKMWREKKVRARLMIHPTF